MHPWLWYRERGGGTHEAGWRNGDEAKRQKERTKQKGARVEVGQRPKTIIGGVGERRVEEVVRKTKGQNRLLKSGADHRKGQSLHHQFCQTWRTLRLGPQPLEPSYYFCSLIDPVIIQPKL